MSTVTRPRPRPRPRPGYGNDPIIRLQSKRLIKSKPTPRPNDVHIVAYETDYQLIDRSPTIRNIHYGQHRR